MTILKKKDSQQYIKFLIIGTIMNIDLILDKKGRINVNVVDAVIVIAIQKLKVVMVVVQKEK